MSTDDLTPRARLLTYLELFVAGQMSAETFAGHFEHVYSFELPKNDLRQAEADALAVLFEKVAWFSPIEEERRCIPHYVGPDELLAAARTARAVIGPSPRRGSGSFDPPAIP